MAPAKQAGGLCGGRPRCDGLRRPQIVDLVAVAAGDGRVHEARVVLARLVGHHGDEPVFVDEAEPAAPGSALDLALFAQVGISRLLQHVLEHADRAFVQDVEAAEDRRAHAARERIAVQCHGLTARVRHALVDPEEIVVLDRDLPLEAQATAVVPAERDRVCRRQRRPVGRPHRLGRGQGRRAGGGDPAELGEIGLRGALAATAARPRANRARPSRGTWSGADRRSAPPFSEIEPAATGVSIVTRASRASTALRSGFGLGEKAGGGAAGDRRCAGRNAGAPGAGSVVPAGAATCSLAARRSASARCWATRGWL